MRKIRKKLTKSHSKLTGRKLTRRLVKSPNKAKKIGKPLKQRRVIGKKAVPFSQESVATVQPPTYIEEKPQYYPRPAPYPISQPQEESWQLPAGYGDNRIVLLTRDPYWLYTYWEINHQIRENTRRELGESYHKSRLILRIYDVTDIIFTGYNAHHFFDIGITEEANNWYINVGKPGRSHCVDIGFLTPDNKFILLARSNIVRTPLDGPSDILDEEWMVATDDFQKLYALSALGMGSSPVGIKKKLAQRLKMELSSGAISSLFSPMGKKERKFWLVVNTELIVYGATEPDASVTVQGCPIKLNKDGTFSLRFALPDGNQVIPVKAVSNDKQDQFTITPVVNKETK